MSGIKPQKSPGVSRGMVALISTTESAGWVLRIQAS